MGLEMRKMGEKEAMDKDLRRFPEMKKPVCMRGAGRLRVECMIGQSAKSPGGFISVRGLDRIPPGGL